MLKETITCLVAVLLLVGTVPGSATFEAPDADGTTDVAYASDGFGSIPACDSGDEELTVNAGPDFETSKDETVRFFADLDPDDADVEVASYEWRDEYGSQGKGKGKNGGRGGADRTLSTEKSFETQLKAGEYTIALTVELANGRTLTDSVNVTVRGKGGGAETDSPPEADTGNCRMVIANEDTRLNATESYDRDGTIERYEWDLDGDGSTDVTGETPTVQFDELGNRTVELTVTDDGGNTDNDTVQLFVNDRPQAVFEYVPTRPNPNESVTFDATAASDTLGGIDSYRWDFDGDSEFDATGETVTHAFTTPGNHTVALEVIDAYGVHNDTTTTVHVNHPPTANASESDRRVNVSESVTLDGTSSTDPENGIERYEWDVDGDGEFEKTGATVEHSYASHGERNVTLRVTDDGNLTDTDTVTVEVNAPPTARIDSSNQTVRIGESVVFDGSNSTDVDGEIERYEWDLDGDGTTDATGPTGERAYDTDGPHTVALTVIDDDGATDTATTTVVVLPEQVDSKPPGVPGPPDDPKGGSGTGDPHLTTFDGQYYDFQAAGEYVLARAPNGSLSVQARLDPVSDRPVSVIEAVATEVDGHNVTIDAADAAPLVVDGTRRSLNRTDRLAVGNGTVFRRGSKYVVVYPGADGEVDDGDERLTVRIRANRLDVWLTLQSDRAHAVEGLLGTPDPSAPDVALANGSAVSPSDYDVLYGAFRDDWRVDSRAESHFHYEHGESPDSFYDPDYPSELLTVEDLSDDERSAAEQAAEEAGLEPGTAAFENAVLDYAVTDDDSYLESAATSRPVNATFSVEAGSSFEAGVGDPITFVATVQNESAANVTVEWRFGDGTMVTGQEVTHAYDANGTYTVTVTATGPNGGIARDTLAVTAGENLTTDQPLVPEVEVTRPNATHVRLNASGSLDPDGTVAGYAWDTDGDGVVEAYGSTATVSLESASSELSLVVLDGDGNRALTTVQVNSPPEADAAASSTTVQVGERVTFDASNSSDLDGDSLTYEWDFDGDGTVDATGETVTNAFGESGTYEVSVTVTDDTGLSSTETTTVTVEGVITDGLVVNWKLDGDGTDSAGSYDGSVDGDATFVDGRVGQAGQFDGSGDDIEISTNDGLPTKAITVATWVSFDRTPGEVKEYFVGVRHNGDGDGWGLRTLENGELQFVISSGRWSGTAVSGSVSSLNLKSETWYHITATWDGSTMSLYVNGTKVATKSYSSRITYGDTKPAIASMRKGFDKHNFDGTIDDVRIYNRALSSWEVDVLATGNARPSASIAVSATDVEVSESVTFDASNSSDLDGDSLTYEWDFDGDGTVDATGETVNHSYSESGTYNATLRVTDDDGVTDTDTRTITVDDGATLTVSNPTSYDLSDYQVQVTIDYKSEMQSDFDDIRFYQNGVELPYWIEDKDNGSQATVWVRLDSIPANGDVTVDFDYGNSSAVSHSDPRATMVVYDFHGGNGFSGKSLGGSARVMDGGEFLELTDTVDKQRSYAAYGTTPAPGFYVEYEYYVGDGTGADSVGIHAWHDGTHRYNENPDRHGVTWMMNDHDDCVGVSWDSQCGDIGNFSANPVTGSWEHATSWGVRDGNTLTYFHSTLGTTVQGSWSNSNFPPGSKFGFSGRTGGVNNHHWVKNVTIRRYAGQSMNTTIQYK